MADIGVAGGPSTVRARTGPAGELEDIADDLARAALAVARRFAAGATMWCIAPSWPHHARHVAVEFVHPVIVGTRALPAVSVTDPDPVSALRVMVRPGDVLIGISPAACAPAAQAMRRAAAWGALSVWLGAGARPAAGAADHVLWADALRGDDPPGGDEPGGDQHGGAGGEQHGGAGGDQHGRDQHGGAGVDGSLVLLYHLLWELTHVCFEHPGLLAPEPALEMGGCVVDGGCITCSDEGLLAEVMSATGDSTASVRTAGGQTVIDTTLVGPVGPGDLLLVHAGSAIARLEQGDA
jgi:hypothetical protein